MTEIPIPYGKTQIIATFPDTYPVEHIIPAKVEPTPDPITMVQQAIREPLGDSGLDLTNVNTITIAINDKTRPVPHDALLPPLLARLESLGAPRESITFIIATGSHPPMPPEEYPMILPDDIIANYQVICHDATDDDSLVHLGNTTRGTPVYINQHFMDADLRVVVGNIEPHQFQGFSGGVKSAAIGLAGKATIRHNHAMMTMDDARLGRYEHNPAREDVEEIGRMINVHFALNVVLNVEKRIVQVVAGHPKDVMHAAIPTVRRIYQVPVAAPFDLIVASPGGHPKDINLYQAQKALAHAALVANDGATVVLVAACPEGSGSPGYEQWMTHPKMTSHNAVIERIKHEGFRIGPHKAFLLSRDATRLNVLFVSEMDPDLARRLLLRPAESLDEAIGEALANLPPQARIGIMPVANATIPVLTDHP